MKQLLRKGIKMKKSLLSLVIVSFLLLSISGCVPLIVGASVGAVGGYVVSKDTVEGNIDKPFDDLWNSSQELARNSGTVKKEDYDKGQIQFIAKDSSIVWINLSRLTRSATKIRVSSRRFHFPNLTLAQDIFVKILGEAK